MSKDSPSSPDIFHDAIDNVKKLRTIIMGDKKDTVSNNTRSKSSQPQPIPNPSSPKLPDTTKPPPNVPKPAKPAPSKDKNNKNENWTPQPVQPMPNLGPDPIDPTDQYDPDQTVIAAGVSAPPINSPLLQPGLYPTLPNAQSTMMVPPPYEDTWKSKYLKLLSENQESQRHNAKVLRDAEEEINLMHQTQAQLKEEIYEIRNTQARDRMKHQRALNEQALEAQQLESNLLEQIQEMEDSLQQSVIRSKTAQKAAVTPERPAQRETPLLNRHSYRDDHQPNYSRHENSRDNRSSYHREDNTSYRDNTLDMSDSRIFARALASNAYQLEEYDGKKPVSIWIKKFKNFIEEIDCNPKLLLESKLKSTASDWFIEMNFSRRDTIEDMLEQLRSRFAKNRYEKSQDLRKLMSDHQRSHESPRDWLERAAKMARGLTISQTGLADIIVGGVRPERDHDMILGILGDRMEDITLNELRNTSMFRIRKKVTVSTDDEDEINLTEEIQSRGRPRERNNYNTNNYTPNNIQARDQTPGTDNRFPRDRSRSSSRNRSTSRTRISNRNPGTCDRCGKSTPNCESATKNDNRLCYYYITSSKCNKCQKIGHAESMCWHTGAGRSSAQE